MSNQLRFDVMIGLLIGNENSVEAFGKGVGQKIITLSLADDALHFTFENGYRMRLFDDGQSCCEHRYMMTDDNLADFIGSTLLDAEVNDAPNEPDKYGEHEVALLVVKTSVGVFTCATHNEHNGYSGGFLIRAAEE